MPADEPLARLTNCGHPPPLLLRPSQEPRPVAADAAPPLGVPPHLGQLARRDHRALRHRRHPAAVHRRRDRRPRHLRRLPSAGRARRPLGPLPADRTRQAPAPRPAHTSFHVLDQHAVGQGRPDGAGPLHSGWSGRPRCRSLPHRGERWTARPVETDPSASAAHHPPSAVGERRYVVGGGAYRALGYRRQWITLRRSPGTVRV
ncbi:hypothetical protein ABZX74_01460 [Streptomyces olivaceoviridis]|uniref:hypothetical protein n=1 Tax=Streptomyces olivaceoviridis TaxID=1921 RepID=UPI0033AF0EF8